MPTTLYGVPTQVANALYQVQFSLFQLRGELARARDKAASFVQTPKRRQREEHQRTEDGTESRKRLASFFEDGRKRSVLTKKELQRTSVNLSFQRYETVELRNNHGDKTL